jgi:hypothetical protein
LLSAPNFIAAKVAFHSGNAGASHVFGCAASVRETTEKDIMAVGQAVAACFVSDDYRKGRRVFVEKCNLG